MSRVSVKKSWTALSFLDKITPYKPVSFNEPGDTLLKVMYIQTRPGQLRWLERPIECPCWEVQKLRDGHMWLVLGKEIWTEVRDYGEIERWGSENKWGQTCRISLWEKEQRRTQSGWCPEDKEELVWNCGSGWKDQGQQQWQEG